MYPSLTSRLAVLREAVAIMLPPGEQRKQDQHARGEPLELARDQRAAHGQQDAEPHEEEDGTHEHGGEAVTHF